MGFKPRAGLGIAAVACMLATAGCGDQTADGRRPIEPLAASDVERLADQTLAEIGGDARQREAKHYLVFRDLNQPFEDCMGAHGVDFHAEYHTINAGFVPNGTSGTWMGALHRRPSEWALANAEAAYDDAVTELRTAEDSPDDQKARRACDSAVGGENQVVYSDADQDELAAVYARMLDEVERQLGPIGPYTECMARAGIDYTTASDGEEGWSGLYLYLTARMPRPPLPGDHPDQEWSKYLELEQRALAADAECRRDRYAKGLELMGPRLQDFRDQHAAQLRASSSTWNDYVERAEVAGFTWQLGAN